MASETTPAIVGTLNSLFSIPGVREHLVSGGLPVTTADSAAVHASSTATAVIPSLPSTSGTLEGKQHNYWQVIVSCVSFVCKKKKKKVLAYVILCLVASW